MALGARPSDDSAPLVNALTIDVEEHFHPNAMDDAVSPDQWDKLPQRAASNTYRLIDMLDELEVRATFFVLGWVAERQHQLVKEIARRGHEIACHGHRHRLVYKLTPEEFRTDVVQAKRVLEDLIGAPVVGFRAASCSLVESTLWALDILIEEGFEYDSSIFPIRHDIYGIPDFQRFPVRLRCPAGEIAEIPLSTVRLWGRNWPVAGGGYLRFLPYWMTRAAVRRINRRDRAAAIVYVHPWEIDVAQPRLPASPRARLRQYTNLRHTEKRLRKLLGEFRFAPLRDAVPWSEIPTAEPVTIHRATQLR
jgi:polysaccharide deacetylase family protein (PEP-CTERM system associated)